MRTLVLATLAVLGLAAVACADDSSTATSASATTTVAAAPSVSLKPTTSAPTTAPTVATTATVSAPQSPTGAEQQQVIDQFVTEQPVEFSIVVRDLQTGMTVAHQADREVWSASLYKLYVARELLDREMNGLLDRTESAGEPQGRTWDQCLRDMIVVSDDDCGVAGIDLVGRGALDPKLALLGYPGTHLDNPQRTTAADTAAILTATYDRSLLGPEGAAGAQELWDYLVAQQVNDRLSRGLPSGTPFAHKTGDRTGWAHDAGVITSPTGDYLVVALSGPYPAPCCHAEAPGPAEATAFAAFSDLAARLWHVFSDAG